MQDSLLSGIISGLITSALLFVGTILWRKQISPWIENLLYRDAQIEGTWNGILIPYIGLDELDKIRKASAWELFEKINLAKNMREKSDEEITPQDSDQAVIPQYDSDGKIIAEIMIPEKNQKEQESEAQPKRKGYSVKISIKPEPIAIKVELARTGHDIVGRVIEIGGASSVCSYTLRGQFRNLILACVYETESKGDMDRGSCSLMLKGNGKKLEGFFSSYNNNNNSISPMLCVIKKQGYLMEKNTD